MSITEENIHFLINNIVFPVQLPQQASKTENDGILLPLVGQVIEYLLGFGMLDSMREKLNEIKQFIDTWSYLQSETDLSKKEIHKAINKLTNGQVIALYLEKQNATLIIHMEDKPIIAAFQCSAKNIDVMSNNGELIGTYPQRAIRINDTKTIKSQTFACIIEELANTPIDEAAAKTKKREIEHTEVRDVVNPDYVFDWLLPALGADSAIVEDKYQSVVCKKIRDNVSYNNTLIPFRRSPLWMSIKVCLQVRLFQLFGHENGLILYKAIVLKIIDDICVHSTRQSIDIKTQIVKKVALRIEKLEKLAESSDLKPTIEQLIKTAAKNVDNTCRNMQECFDRTIQASRSQPAALDYSSIDKNDCKHDFNSLQSNISNFNKLFEQQNKNDVSPPNCPQRNYLDCEFPNVELLNVSGENQSLISLNDIEVWIKSIDLDEIKFSDKYSSAKMFNLFDEYLKKALNFYSNDELGFSRMTYVSIKIVCILDKLATLEYPLLNEHHIGFGDKQLKDLLIERSSDMDEIVKTRIYIINRQKKASYPDLLSPIITHYSFGVRFYNLYINEANQMKELKKKIEEIAHKKKQEKEKEVEEARREYYELERKIERMSCTYSTDRWGNTNHCRYCDKCSYRRTADGMSVSIYEWPLPENENNAQQVIFELRIPSKISYLRDSLHLLNSKIFKSVPESNTSEIRCTWTSYYELSQYFIGTQKYITYGSTTKRFSETHYSSKHPREPTHVFLPSNNYTTELCDHRQTVSYPDYYEKFKKLNTFKLMEPYNCLQWTIPNTTHSENEVLAKQSLCPKELTLREFINFGFLRSGHRLQIRNILNAFEIRSLSFENISVVLLIQQALWQIGPFDGIFEETTSQLDLQNTLVIDTLYVILNDYLELNAKTWSKSLFILNLINITAKSISLVINDASRLKMVNLMQKIRGVLIDWFRSIKKCIKETDKGEKDALTKLRKNLFNVCCMIIFTFWIDKDRMRLLLNSNKDIVQWFTAMTYLRNNCSFVESIDNNDKEQIFQRNLFRRAILCQLEIEDLLINLIFQDNFTAIEEFLIGYWPDGKIGKFEKWSTYGRPDKHWFYTRFNSIQSESNAIEKINVIIQISIDGSFLVHGRTVGTLPLKIYTHKNYLDFFHHINFDVNPSSKAINEYVTDDVEVKSIGCINYTFIHQNEELLITERRSSSAFIYIPNRFLKDILPYKLYTEYSHWYNENSKTIEFRQKRFDDEYNGLVYFKLDLNSGYVVDLLNKQDLIDINSKSFRQIFEKFIFRLEMKQYVHIFNKSSLFLISLPRFGLNFYIYDNDKTKVLSKEYRGMKVAECQKLGTLLGLEQGLVLVDDITQDNHLARKQLIVPNGPVGLDGLVNNHQNVFIKITELRQPSYYFYYVDTTLCKLRAEESICGWHYLALLHASTASPLPDPFTQTTGTEMSLQILQSGNSWSCKPLNEESLFILKQIEKLSPSREYYPPNMNIMETACFPAYLPTTCAHDGYWLIVEKLINDSNRMKFQYGIKEKQNKNKDEHSDRLLSSRAYHRVKKYYSYLAQLTGDFESAVSRKSKPKNVFNSVFDWFANNIRDVRIIASNTYKPTKDFDFEKLFYSISKWSKGATLVRAHEGNFLVCSIPLWVEISRELNYRLIDLYNISIDYLDSEKSKIFLFLLSFLAYKINNVDILLFFQNINRYKCKFINIREPSNSHYDDLFEYSYDGSKIRNILQNYFPSLDNYADKQHKGYFESVESFNKRVKDSYLEDKNKEITSVENYVRENWTSYQSIYIRTNYISDDVRSVIQALLIKWNKNRNLREFILEISNNFKSLALEYEKVVMTTISGSNNDVSKYEYVCKREILVDSTDEIVQEVKQIYEKGRINEIGMKKLENTDESLEISYQSFPFSDEFNECGVTKALLGNLEQSWNAYVAQKSNRFQNKIDSNELRNNLLNSRLQLNKKINEIEKFLRNCLMKNQITCTLMTVNILPPFIPQVTLKYLLNEFDPNFVICNNFKYLIGGLSVLWSLKQRIERFLLHLNLNNSSIDNTFLTEVFINEPHQNWSPALRPEWLIFELESNVTIRAVQVEVAEKMIQPENNENSVMQLNMGEGKTSVIVPLVITALANRENIVRLVVLKSLLNTNYKQLCYKLGGILNKRVYMLPCRRDMNFTKSNLESIETLLRECQSMKGVFITLPEYQLSFKLKTLELCRTPDERSKKAVQIKNYMETYIRDILDESDEILSVKNQLVYTCGNYQTVDGGCLRWKIAYLVLMSAKNHLNDIKSKFGDESIEVQYDQKYPQAYPYFRILKQDAFKYLCDKISDDILDGKVRLQELRFAQPDANQKYHLKLYLLNNHVEDETRRVISTIEDICSLSLKALYTLRGFFTYDVLFTVLNKRWRVDYGVNSIDKFLLQAVPYRAKDIPAERAQFAHPDIIILLTYLSYFYSGLNDQQLDSVFDSLEKSSSATEEYESWIKNLPDEFKVDKSIREYSGINLFDVKQKKEVLYPTFKKHTATIHYWLCEFVFRREAKEFTQKLNASFWDLCKTSERPMTGFSGTNDSMMILLPLNTSYHQIPHLLGTSGMLLIHLMKDENNFYENLKAESRGVDIVKLLAKDYSNNLRLLLDCGALMIDLTNEKVIEEWLSLVPQAEAGVCFDSNNNLIVIDRKLIKTSFELSPFKLQLDKCVVYLDDSHTRGTDLKFPIGTIGMVTLGRGLTKDRLMQACMRLRKLGNGHTVRFLASNEVHNKILNDFANNNPITSTTVLQWSINNTRNQLVNDLLYWSTQGLSFYRREAVLDEFKVTQDHLKFAEKTIESESNELKKMYDANRDEKKLVDIVENCSKIINKQITSDRFWTNALKIHDKLKTYMSNEKRFSNLLDEEQELELEAELEEEREIERPPLSSPHKNHLDNDVKAAILNGLFSVSKKENIRPIYHACIGTSIEKLFQKEAWSDKIVITRDFIQTVNSKDQVDLYMRPPRWLCVQENAILIISSFEANELFDCFDNKTSKLVCYLPRTSRETQKISFSFPNVALSNDLLAQLNLFSGNLYFNDVKEEMAFCKFIGYCPSPRNTYLEKLFNDGLIKHNGYVEIQHRTYVFGSSDSSNFKNDPKELINKLGELRNYGLVPKTSHYLDILSGKLVKSIEFEV